MYFSLFFKARRLERRQKKLEEEKKISWKEYQKRKDNKLGRRYRNLCKWLFNKCFPRNSKTYRLLFKIKHHGTCENFTVKSFAGFVGGFLLTYVFFMFFVLQLNYKLSTATIVCAVVGSILTIGLAFSYKVRCIVFLVLPQFFSKKGRHALLAYAYILAITGPAKNTLNNMSILGESLACGQEQLKDAVRQIIAVIKKPFYAIKDAIKAVVKAVKEIVKKIKEILLTIKRIIISILKIIKAGFKFLASIMNMCNKEIGTPFERCKRIFENAIVDCNAKLGPLFNWLCNITYLVKSVCYVVKLLDVICFVVDFIKDTVTVVVTKVKQFVRHIRVMFYVRIKFSHSYHFESNRSKSIDDITTGIVTEIKERSSGLIKIFDFMSSAASLFFLFIVFQVTYYRYKFLTSERFDNRFITKNFLFIDLRRVQLRLETVLPLNHRERQLYVTTSSLRLVKREKKQLSKSAMFLLMATLKLCTHMATDYSLYWILLLIRRYGRFQSKVPAPKVPTLHIEGEGFIANLLKAIVKAFQPLGIVLEVDTIPCLPDPIPPDFDRYIQIASLLVLCWFLAIFEPYGLRLRHSVMCYYHPQRARERAIWLYNNIMRSRSSFLKFARRQLRRKVTGDSKITKVTLMEFIRAKLHCKIFTFILGSGKQDACLLCGEVFRENDEAKPILCQTPNCPGMYCEKCFTDLQNLCTVCLDPIQYGDLSDISEEKDSSDTDTGRRYTPKSEPGKKRQRKKKCNLFKLLSKKSDDKEEDTDKEELISKGDTKDSDYYSSSPELKTDESDGYDYSYQENKDITKAASIPDTRSSFVDLEKQHIPEYASLQDFQNDPVLEKELKRIEKEFSEEEYEEYYSSSSDISEIIAGRNDSELLISPIDSADRAKVNLNTKISSSKLSLDQSQIKIGESSIPTTTTIANESEEPTECHCPTMDHTQPTNVNFAYDTVDMFKRKVNSKISTESIELDDFISETSINDSLSICFQTTPSNTTIIASPQPKKEKTARENQYIETSFILNILNEEQINKQPDVHPDIPKLNLNFLEKESCRCNDLSPSPVTKSSCNCRFFKKSVKYGTISETKRSFSSSSSSLITDLKTPKRKTGESQTSPIKVLIDKTTQSVQTIPESVEVSTQVQILPLTPDSESNKDFTSSPSPEFSTSPLSPNTASSYQRGSIGQYSETSSLISSLARIPKRPRKFSMKKAVLAISIDENAPPEDVDMFEEPSPTTPLTAAKPVLQKYKRVPKNQKFLELDSQDTSTDSTASFLLESFPSSHSSREVFITDYDDFEEKKEQYTELPTEDKLPDTQLSLRRKTTYDDKNKIYRNRIRDYYKQLQVEQYKSHKPPKAKHGVLRKFLQFFKKKKKLDLD